MTGRSATTSGTTTLQTTRRTTPAADTAGTATGSTAAEEPVAEKPGGPESSAKPTRWRAQLFLTFIAVGLVYVAVGFTIPVLPAHVTTTLGGDAGDVGWVMGSYAITAVVARPLFGFWLNRAGTRRIVLIGALLVGLSSLLCIPTGSVAALIACRLLLGVGLGAVLSAATIWMVALAPADRQGWAIGMVGTINYVVLAVGAPFGRLFTDLAGMTTTFVVAGIAPLLAVPAVLAVPDHRGERRPDDAGARRGGSPLAAAALPGFALALAAFAHAAVISFSPIALQQRGVPSVSAVITAFAITMVVTRVLGAKIRWNFTSPKGMAAVFGAEILGMLLLAVAQEPVAAVVVGVLVGLGMSQIYPALGLLVLRTTSPDRRGPALATYGAFINVGISAGNGVLGALAGSMSYTAMFAAAAGFVGLGSLVAAVTAARTPPEQAVPA